MDRRTFLSRAGGTALLGAPLAPQPALAATILPPQGLAAAAPLSVVGPCDQPAARMLARALVQALADAGWQARLHGHDLADLRRADRLEALLSQPRGALLLGVTDDASAVIVQAMAASRGARLLAHGHHRLAGGRARHACTAIGCDETFVWSEAAGEAAAPIQAVYLAALGAHPVRSRARRALRAPAGTGDAVSSFLIRL